MSADTNQTGTTGTSPVVAEAPNVALSMFYQSAGQAYSITMQNAASNQQNLNTLNPSIVAQAIALINKT
ncbi:RebB like protein [Agrobacterium vitis]|uniref:RebB like protein n=1 Tax=Agrobacterium vitis TaxID=373 RepID=A0ABD6GIM8_AGRVI|nr:RebB family R body protein [Agrobacterium vitis]MCE6076506.1 RebB like protein [Agrobacterium vitis]MCF1452182.1 RebB like protein [Agrobacterium vitis]MCF1466149.1 RebB like protein [Agrobacterium vitis]MCM2451658.1 RebB like protein [Agrobacterium vitis]MCM2471200.1 RebB like protein [Agrobacterium vitis]